MTIGGEDGGRGDMPIGGFQNVVRIRPVLGHDPDEMCVSWDTEKGNVRVEGQGFVNREYEGFPLVLDPDTTQQEAFEKMRVPELIDKVLEGFHTTIMAYGQTGSGKTHTVMGGTKELDGIVPQAVVTLFKKLHNVLLSLTTVT